MPVSAPIPAEKLYRICDPDSFGFESSADLKRTPPILGQTRANEAIAFGLSIREPGYHVFAAGPVGVGKYGTVRRHADLLAREIDPPDDWCYVYNFQDPYKPKAIRLPAGHAYAFKTDVEGMTEDLRTALQAAFESEGFRTRQRAISEEFEGRERSGLQAIEQEARSLSLGMHRAEQGLMFVPLGENGEPMAPDGWQALDQERRERFERDVEQMQRKAEALIVQVSAWQREFRSRSRDLSREVTRAAVTDVMAAVRSQYKEMDGVVRYLDHLAQDVIDSVRELVGDDNAPDAASKGRRRLGEESSRRYRVNVLTTSGPAGAPVVYEENPNYANLVGRVEYMPEQGALIADYNLIKPGALHRANGGYLILDAQKLLSQPGAYDGLKRALKYRRIRIESLGQSNNMISTVSLDPEPIPVDVKVVLIGDRQIYYALKTGDAEFDDLFKVLADFEEDLEWSSRNAKAYGRLLADTVRSTGLRPFDKHAIARITEQGARLAGNATKLTTRFQSLHDLMREANHIASEASDGLVTADHVASALEARVEREGRIPDRIREVMLTKTILIDTSGSKVGQINGLSVSQFGDTAYGKPTRITAQVRMGRGEVVDIEREVALSGPIHSKGVLILSGFLAGRFATEHPLSLSASLVFEQSYGGIDGDSASSAELYALLSAISGVPIDQSFAVTGSVNQYGEVQAIGGANEKIEGFFDLCSERKLTGKQGVLIPAANAKDLMLKKEVVDAAREGRFRVIPVRTIDEGIEILTGQPAGRRRSNGSFPDDSINAKVQERLIRLAEKRMTFLHGDESSS